ncbi:hypothetical protein RUND412_006441 [Rhizina undulata]
MEHYTLPTIFHFIFVILEPLSTFAGFIYPYLSPSRFLAEQIPHSPSAPASIGPNEQMTVLQLANCYLLLAMCSTAVLRAAREKAVVRNYLVALWLGDVGHLYFTWAVVGNRLFFNPREWNALLAGNVGFTAFLFISRTIYLYGWGFSDDKCAEMKQKFKQ